MRDLTSEISVWHASCELSSRVESERSDSGHHLKRPRAIRCDETLMTMSDAAWLIVAVAAGLLLAAAWVSRERAIHRRRRRSAEEETRQ